jgi:hypothetical protein
MFTIANVLPIPQARVAATSTSFSESLPDWIVGKLTVEHWSVPEVKAVLA